MFRHLNKYSRLTRTIKNNSNSLAMFKMKNISIASLVSGHESQVSTLQVRTLMNFFRRDFGEYETIKRPGEVSAISSIPPHIKCPEYYPHGTPRTLEGFSPIKSEEQIEGMRKACRLARTVMNAIGNEIKPGVTGDQLDKLAHEVALSLDCYPSPLRYRGFPKSICTSVNNVVCHGIPDDRPLLANDVVSVDVTVFHEGFHGDCCETWCLPDTDDLGRELVRVARQARDEAIEICAPGVPMALIGETCDRVVNAAGYSVIPVFIGHGIGRNFHEPPEVYHFSNTGSEMMVEGMTFTIEPVVTQGRDAITILEDGWTAVVNDNARGAQFEHTILITKQGYEILTDYF